VTLALILTGPPGAGKSSVLEALTTLLEIDAQVRTEGRAAADVAAEVRDVLAPALRVMG
jgi:putative protein kinase ArgK-like GTPase of G3E family